MDLKEEIKIVNDNNFYKVYDKNGKYLRNIDVKEENSLKDEFLHGVSCFVVNEENQVLMEVRANTKITPGKIDLITGHVNGNEVAIQTAMRELSEEVGISHVLGNEIFRVSGQSKLLRFQDRSKTRNFFIDFYCLITNKHNFTIQSEEVKALKWVPMEEAFLMIKQGKTRFPKQDKNVNYEKVFDNVRKICLNRQLEEKKWLER